jgi:hypothetical protein
MVIPKPASCVVSRQPLCRLSAGPYKVDGFEANSNLQRRCNVLDSSQMHFRSIVRTVVLTSRMIAAHTCNAQACRCPRNCRGTWPGSRDACDMDTSAVKALTCRISRGSDTFLHQPKTECCALQQYHARRKPTTCQRTPIVSEDRHQHLRWALPDHAAHVRQTVDL